MSWRLLLAATVVLGVGSEAIGQNPPARQPGRPGRVRIVRPYNGTVAGVDIRRRMILVKTPTGENWTLQLDTDVEIRVTGRAESDVLRPGMFVRFAGQVDKRRSRVQEKIAKLTIITPSQEAGRMLGAFPPAPGDEGFEMPAKQGEQENPGPQPNGGFPPKGGFPPNDPQPPPAEPEDNTVANVATWDIRARVVSLRGRLLTVFVPNVPNKAFKPSLRVELAEDATIGIDVNDYSLAKPGDKINFTAYHPNEAILTYAVAKTIKIGLSEPLGTSRKKPGRTRPSRRPPKQDEPQEPLEGPQQQPVKPQGGDGPPAGENPPKPEENPPQREKPVPKDDSDGPLVQLLKLTPEELQGKRRLNLNLGDADRQVYTPCKPVTGKTICDGFGLPENSQTIRGKLPIGEGGEQVQVQWQYWVFGRVKVLVDEKGAARYYAVDETTPEKKPDPDEDGKKE